ncbi:MAG TPA: MFS transporter [Candidatus Limnocylindrales bacterium]|nr:MFS transporter [Candidatus Limnocylindrales bacterium]
MTAADGANAAGGRGGRLLTPAMLGVASGAILVPLNSTMLAVALPSVATAFGVGPSDVASLVTLYLGAVAVTLPASGSIGDRFGHRRSFVTGVLGFGAASLVAAFAPSFGVLAVSRVLQAASGSLVSTSSVSLIRDLAPADRRGAAFGVFDLLVSSSAAIGPLIGGLIVGAFDWRAMFLLAAPIALVAVASVGLRPPSARAWASADVTSDPHSHQPVPRPIDVWGLVTLGLVLIAFLAALRGGPTALPAALIAAILLGAFLVLEVRSDSPAVDPHLFRSRSFSAAVIGVLGSTVVLHATLVLVPLLVERLDGGDPEASGLVLLGISALGGVAAPFGGRWSDRAGRRTPVVVGSLVMAIGLAALWWIAGSASPLLLGILLAVVGLGMGFTSPRQAAALETVEPDRVGMAAGTYYTGRYLGGVLGASLAGAVLGGAVTAAGVTLGFGALAIVALIVTVASFGLSGRVPHRASPAGRA